MFTFFALVLFTVHSALADDWEPLAGNDQIRSFMSGLTVERTTNDGQTLRGEYRADGTGTVFSFGAPVDRTWDVSDDDKLCINVGSERLCYGLEHNLKEPGTYRATAVDGGESATFRTSALLGVSRVQGKIPSTR